MALSTISQRRWCRPLPSTPPMYIDGRLRTGSSPSRAVRSAAVYLDVVRVLIILRVSYSNTPGAEAIHASHEKIGDGQGEPGNHLQTVQGVGCRQDDRGRPR